MVLEMKNKTMAAQEFSKLKTAIRSMSKPYHLFRITLASASCVWDGSTFLWTDTCGTACKITAEEVIERLTVAYNDGCDMDDYCFDYNEISQEDE